MNNTVRSILYAEDDEEDRLLFLEGVQNINRNMRIITASNGNDVICYLNEISAGEELPSAIVSDLRMPLCDGWDMLRIVKKELRWKHIPVILFSTSSSYADISTAAQLGATAFFYKARNLPGNDGHGEKHS